MATRRTDLGRSLWLLALLPLAGCLTTTGRLYTDKTVPYYLPYGKGAQRASKRCAVNLTQLKEPFSGANLSVLWTSDAVAAAAAGAGMTELRYVDLRTFSLLNDTYVRRSLIFYGE
jgi:hypothetical protein